MKRNKYIKKSKLPWKIYKILDGKPASACVEITYGMEPMIAIYADVFNVSEPAGRFFVAQTDYCSQKKFKTFDKAIAYAEKRIRAKVMRITKELQKYI